MKIYFTIKIFLTGLLITSPTIAKTVLEEPIIFSDFNDLKHKLVLIEDQLEYTEKYDLNLVMIYFSTYRSNLLKIDIESKNFDQWCHLTFNNKSPREFILIIAGLILAEYLGGLDDQAPFNEVFEEGTSPQKQRFISAKKNQAKELIEKYTTTQSSFIKPDNQ